MPRRETGDTWTLFSQGVKVMFTAPSSHPWKNRGPVFQQAEMLLQKSVHCFEAFDSKLGFSSWKFWRSTTSRKNPRRFQYEADFEYETYKPRKKKSPENSGMSPENQWLEDVFPLEIVPFWWTCLFSGMEQQQKPLKNDANGRRSDFLSRWALCMMIEGVLFYPAYRKGLGGSTLNRGHQELPTQTMHCYFIQIPQNDHRFVLFGSQKIASWMTPAQTCRNETKNPNLQTKNVWVTAHCKANKIQRIMATHHQISTRAPENAHALKITAKPKKNHPK